MHITSEYFDSSINITQLAAPMLEGKKAIITGGSGTIGKGIALALLSKGCNVYITGRNQARLDNAIADIQSLRSNTSGGSGQVFPLVGDCTNEESIVNDIFSKVKEVDLLINNAGTTISKSTEETSAEEFNHVMNVNVSGPFVCAREAMKQMKSRAKGGRIINIGSVSAISSRPNAASYTASKFALLGLTHSLAIDCRDDNIAVGIIHPGNVKSNILSQEDIDGREEAEGFMNPEAVANAVLTMASLPYSANIFEMTILPTKQPFHGRG